MDYKPSVNIETCDWMNVQETVKNLLIHLLQENQQLATDMKSIKGSLINTHNYSDGLHALRCDIEELRRDSCPKSHVAEIETKIRDKASASEISDLDGRLISIEDRVSILARSMESHQRDLSQLYSKIDIIRDEISLQRDSDTHFIKKCIEDRILQFNAEVDEKIRTFFASKFESTSGKPVDYERLEGLIRSLNLQVHDVKVSSDKMITKDEFRLAICNKADIEDIQNLESGLGERVIKLEKHAVGSSQIMAIGIY